MLLKVRAPSLLLRVALATGLLSLGSVAQAQSSACAANETQQSYTFAAPNNWPAGNATIGYTIGVGASSVTVGGTATLADIVAGSPSTQPTGGFADSYSYIVNRANTTTSNTVTITFSKPISKFQVVATDLDFGGTTTNAYQDRVTLVGTGPSGTVTPTAVATNPALVGVVGNVATSLSTDQNQNCPTTGTGADQCNVTYSFPQPITSFTYTYGNGPGAVGNPPEQQVGMAALGFCIQNPDLALVKDDGGASFSAGGSGTYTFTVSNVGSTGTSGTTTVKDILPAGLSFGTPLTPGGANAAAWTCVRSTTTNANDTATCTSTTVIAAAGTSTFTLPVAVAAGTTGTTLSNRAKVFGGGDPNKAAETTTGAITACASDGLAGAVANAGCGFETTPIISIPPATPTLSCTSSASIFNTAFNGQSGPPLASGNDPVWETNSQVTGQTTPPTGGTWSLAYVVNAANKPAPWIASPFNNAQWISYAANANHIAAGSNDVWFRYTFNLAAGIAPSDLALQLSFYADNSVTGIYVNGVQQAVAGVPPAGNVYQYAGYAAGAQVSATLASNWQVGSNTILVRVSSDPGQIGFLAQVTSNNFCRAAVRITKSDSQNTTTAGSANNYVVTLANQGPGAANGVIVTDVVGAGLTCPAASAVVCTVTGVGAVCPAGPLTIGNLTGAGITVATLPVNGALQFAYTCNVN